MRIDQKDESDYYMLPVDVLERCQKFVLVFQHVGRKQVLVPAVGAVQLRIEALGGPRHSQHANICRQEGVHLGHKNAVVHRGLVIIRMNDQFHG